VEIRQAVFISSISSHKVRLASGGVLTPSEA